MTFGGLGLIDGYLLLCGPAGLEDRCRYSITFTHSKPFTILVCGEGIAKEAEEDGGVVEL